MPGGIGLFYVVKKWIQWTLTKSGRPPGFRTKEHCHISRSILSKFSRIGNSQGAKSTSKKNKQTFSLSLSIHASEREFITDTHPVHRFEVNLVIPCARDKLTDNK